jgi:ATP-dependent DNA helicase RecQ
VVERCFASGEPDDELVAGVLRALKRWPWQARPTWVTWVPGDALAERVASRVASAGKIGLHDALRRERAISSRLGSTSNSAFRQSAVWGAYSVASLPDIDGPVLVLADRYDTGWTMTVIAHLLRIAGSGPVLPFALTRD